MYNINYGDGRGYPPWPKQQAQAPQPPPQPSQQQPAPQPPPLSSQMHHVQRKTPDEANERLWVEVRNEEEVAAMHHIQQTMKAAGSKSHVTPPLDLSENRRQVESPLDLSVKTRKRCADTTEYAEQVARLGLLHEGFLPKRLCQTRDYAYPQGHPNFQQEQHLSDKSYSGEPSERNKMIQQRQKTISKFPTHQISSKTLPSPQSLPQTQFPIDVQRQQHPSQQLRQLPMSQPPKHSTAQYGLSPKHSQPLHPSLPKSHTHPSYEGLSSAVKRTPQTNMTESVALKGFFEPTQKVTVNASSVSQPSPHGPVPPQQSQFPRVPSDSLIAGHPSVRNIPVSSNEVHEFDESRRHQMAFHGPNQSAYSRRLPSNAVGFSGTASEREVMQSKQMQYERHLQQQQQQQQQQQHQQQLQHHHAAKSQREQMVLMAQRNQKPPYPKTPQEQQKLAYMMEMQKQAELRGPVSPAGSGVMFPSRSQYPAYSQARQPVSATLTYQDSLRKEKSDFQAARCTRVTQPVTLSDIQQEHALVLEHVHAVQIRPEMYGPQPMNELNKFSPRMPDPIHSHPQQINQARLQQTVRYEQSRYGGNKETMERNIGYVDRNDPGGIGNMNLHPSVIQRPQGYIPPRIVRGGGLSSESRIQRRPADIPKEQQHISRFEAAQNEQHHRSRLELTHRERATYQQKPQDMLSGKEVMKIQQRVAEQRGDSHSSGSASSRGNYGRSSIGRDHERMASNSSSNTHKNNIGRRKSLPENQIRDAPSRESREIPNPQITETVNVEKRIMAALSGPSSDETKQENGNKTQRKMISSPPCSVERSITKGTSGMQAKCAGEMDPFSQFLMRELKKTDDDNSINPFANRSLLQEFDRSANSSPVRTTQVAQTEITEKHESIDAQSDIDTERKATTPTTPKQKNSSYTLPLQIAIPGHKQSNSQVIANVVSTNTSSLTSHSMTVSSSIQSQTTSSTPRSSVITGSLKAETSSKNPKLMSRKHMILSAFRMEEEIKNTNSLETVNIDIDEKIPMESAKFAARKSEREQTVSYPTSPKMPILSPQERNRSSSSANQSVGEPPNLEESSSSNSGKDCSKKEINSLEEHLHRLISDAVKGSKQDRESVYETVRRELSSQPQVNKVFLSRQLSQTRNIPVANVAPIVHGKSVSDSIDGSDKSDSNNFKEDFDEEDAKMADIVTRSLFGNQALLLKDSKSETNNEQTETSMQCDDEVDKSDSNLSFTSFKEEALFDENSNSKRMSPGLKKLMLYRHRDGSCNSRDEDDNSNRCKDEPDEMEIEEPSNTTSEQCIHHGRSRNKRANSKTRNVFGAFNEIVAQHSSLDKSLSEPCGSSTVGTGEGTIGTRWTGYQQQEKDQHDIHMVFNTDYDGDDEQVRESQLLRWNKPSNTKQHADRLIKKARHRRNSKQDGIRLARHALHRKRRKAQKGFVDFMPQVLPRRTRSKTPVSTKKRKGKTTSPSRKYSKRASSHEIKPETTSHKPRQRRASSLDRETKSKHSKLKSKQTCFSDIELDSDSVAKHGHVSDKNSADSKAIWNNEYESTDEDYFQNYEDKFKQMSHKKENNFKFKKTTTTKKRKGFHFKQTYIFQRKRKSNKGRGRVSDQQQQQQLQQSTRAGHGLDSIYSFHEEGSDVGNLRSSYSSLPSTDHIPVPADLRRVTVNKDSGQTMLHRAVKMGLEEVVLYCLATGSVDVNARDNAGYTALHECAVRGRVQIGKHLLTYGADVNCCSTDGGLRPIHDAVENDHLEVVRLLLSYGADPTLSTYAGRSLMKIARTERMVRFLQRYLSDLNGYATDEEERSWKFKQSSCCLAPETNSGCAIFDNLPSDPEDESHDMFSFSSKPLFSTKRLALEPNKRVEDFLLLDDILQAYGISRYDLQNHGIHHFIKQIPMKTLLDFHQDSIYLENFLQKNECNTIEVIRKVDSTQIISKLEKLCTSVHAKKAKKSKEIPL